MAGEAESPAASFAGALDALVRRGRLPDLARLYPPNPLPEPEILAAAAFDALADADAEIAELGLMIGQYLALGPAAGDDDDVQL